ncbi:nitronate monooxygenase [Acetobacter tropicalis]|uniref:Propionate 3-nitronate monooxygenase n=1 Tax=Acetobacter tropicalis TaxID=104102 RepID=A0A095B501_9PROT|nr:nitronate monooxygenase [Acetobacter tropicalis]MDE5062884.1 nitronate monooxygenase [Wolbachia endosymbiont of Drosophila chauvacae]KAA8388642.1 nitronate monooxygenase [Acetobacter tropicalis]KAA8391200.1 nitronate monooxygenase [Acetobacter tropicalis]KGB24048.1 Enoyl-[acyl-carrier-protein] reductase [FMN] [Acetobacter tropicalis]MBC9009270.1 nitronate monooxygenase [Acetobacter tropicalis]
MIPEISALLTPGFPVIQAPMAGVSDSSVVIKATQAGFLGALGAGMMEPETIQKESRNIRAATSAPFCINLFVLEEPSSNAPDLAPLTWLTDLYAWHNIPFSVPEKCAPSFPAQFEAVLAEAPAVLSCTFGQLSKDQIAACHARNIAVVGTATSTPEALAWADAGADAICAQGIEAGGHRGSFLTAQDQGMGLLPLLQEIRSAVSLPLIAAGGIATGSAILAVLALGACAAQMGTALLPSTDLSLPSPYRKALLNKPFGTDTELTNAFSGRYARGLQNEFLRTSRGKATLPYPIQNALTQPLRKVSAQTDGEHLSLWAGQAVHLGRDISLAALAETLKKELLDASQTLKKQWLSALS